MSLRFPRGRNHVRRLRARQQPRRGQRHRAVARIDSIHGLVRAFTPGMLALKQVRLAGARRIERNYAYLSDPLSAPVLPEPAIAEALAEHADRKFLQVGAARHAVVREHGGDARINPAQFDQRDIGQAIAGLPWRDKGQAVGFLQLGGVLRGGFVTANADRARNTGTLEHRLFDLRPNFGGRSHRRWQRAPEVAWVGTVMIGFADS